MKVLVSCGTKFHSDHLAYQLQRRNILLKLITSHPSIAHHRVKIKRGNILFLPPIFVVSLGLKKILGKFYFFQGRLEWILCLIYDWMASLFVPIETDISISWAWSSLQTIRAVKRNNGITILEECGSCNKYQENLLQEEYENLSLKYVSKTFNKIISRELLECEEADFVLCPSRHVVDSFLKQGISSNKLIFIPYGVELELFSPQPRKDSIFRILFVGTVGVRKGIIYLLEALKVLEIQFECLIIGKVESDFKNLFQTYSPFFKHIERVEHSQLKYYYSNASIFVFPSLDEGMAYVQLEAMACGLPVICTPNSGGDSVIRDGQDGFIVPIRDPISIKDKIEYLYQNPSELQRMSQNSLLRAKEFTWERYGRELEETLLKLIAIKAQSKQA